LKQNVYLTELASPEEVIARMQLTIRSINGAMLRRVRENLIVRTEACIKARGGHIENLL
ncbi:hypothetical protein EAG_15357, partial [Camponotus floridanus]